MKEKTLNSSVVSKRLTESEHGVKFSVSKLKKKKNKIIPVTKLSIVGFKRKPERPESPPDNKPRPSEGSESGEQPLLALESFAVFFLLFLFFPP